MTHHTDTERAAFEAAIRATMHDAGEDHIAERLERWPDGAYKDRATGYAWWGYQQAARRAPVVPVPQEWRESLTAFVAAMRKYEMDVDGPAPEKHRAMMKRANKLLLAAAPQPPEAEQLDDTNVADMAQAVDSKEAAPVQLPEPVAAESRFTTFAGDRWRWCTVEHARAFGADKGYEVRYLYTEQQVRELLAAHGIKEQST